MDLFMKSIAFDTFVKPKHFRDEVKQEVMPVSS